MPCRRRYYRTANPARLRTCSGPEAGGQSARRAIEHACKDDRAERLLPFAADREAYARQSKHRASAVIALGIIARNGIRRGSRSSFTG